MRSLIQSTDRSNPLLLSTMSLGKVYVTLAIDALQRCSPRFQVYTLFAVFLSILLSTVYFVYLALYAPVERVVILLALCYAGWQIQPSSSVHQLPNVYSEPSILPNTSYEPALPAYTPKSTISTISDDSGVSLPAVRPSAARSNSTEPSPESPPSIGPTNVSALSVPQSIFSASPIVEILDRSPPSSQSTLHPVTSVKVPIVASFMDSSVSTSLNETIQRRKLLEGFAESGNPIRQSRQVVYTSFDKLPASGYIKPVRRINESADGILEWEFPHQHIDYCVQATASETLQLYEESVKRPP